MSTLPIAVKGSKYTQTPRCGYLIDYAYVQTSGPALALKRREDGMFSIASSDATFANQTLVYTIKAVLNNLESTNNEELKLTVNLKLPNETQAQQNTSVGPISQIIAANVSFNTTTKNQSKEVKVIPVEPPYIVSVTQLAIMTIALG